MNLYEDLKQVGENIYRGYLEWRINRTKESISYYNKLRKDNEIVGLVPLSILDTNFIFYSLNMKRIGLEDKLKSLTKQSPSELARVN